MLAKVPFPRGRRATARLAEAFPGDPCKGDFAFYGLGIDEEASMTSPACGVSIRQSGRAARR